ncbi:hypothetical protein FNV43_RR00146 [Rhamnella rubrinervis]|uniref:Bulb-type lectin domain-containing protein n=1 Tax=Rhamnella rubrinervis TaxID=2594499 RepID=A0A8K0HN47_9ROSA|nr:hypothetical protein FNV43_RR00146 [Rhamnella rubrinervis]
MGDLWEVRQNLNRAWLNWGQYRLERAKGFLNWGQYPLERAKGFVGTLKLSVLPRLNWGQYRLERAKGFVGTLKLSCLSGSNPKKLLPSGSNPRGAVAKWGQYPLERAKGFVGTLKLSVLPRLNWGQYRLERAKGNSKVKRAPVGVILGWIMFFGFCTCLDTISTTQPIRDGDGSGDVLVSNGDTFALGFFSPGKSNYRYVGIWYHKIPEKTVVWVANRDNPINDTSGFLSIDTQGNLVLFDNNDQTVPVWSTNSSSLPTNEYAVAQLLDSGNLVLFQNESKRFLWKSFDYPTDTMLPNMKLGIDRRNGLNWFLTSWKSEDDPGIGNYTYRIDSAGFPQLILYNG